MENSMEAFGTYRESGLYDICPLVEEMPANGITPLDVTRTVLGVSGHCFMLESADSSKKFGRYTFIGYEPKLGITCTDGMMSIDGKDFATKDPAGELRDILKGYRSPRIEGLPPFTGGLVGYFSYDYLKYSEPTLRLDAKDTEGFKDIDLMLFDSLIVFDNERDSILLIRNVSLNDLENDYPKAVEEISKMRNLVINGKRRQDLGGRLTSDVRELFSEQQFCSMVERAKHHIFEGDVFQMVLSNRLEADYEGSLFDAYTVLRNKNPSPYMFYFSGSDMEVAGASPETLVKLEDGVLHTFPLAGTRPRGKTEKEDLALERELLSDEKELAEHNMLVDLGRNDLGKISVWGSVEVEKLHSVERFSHVMHIGSTVRGRMRPDMDALDAVRAILPAGTLSGAPKIRACQLINDIEDNKRGIYGGGLGYIDFSGNLDLCIAIRIAYKKNGKVFVRSGAGIVADSVPENEYRESINKAAAVVASLREAGGIQ